MRSSFARNFLILLLSAVAAGCSGTYQPPSSPEPESTGTIIGTKIADGRFFISKIDRDTVEDAPAYAEKPLVIEEGRHLLIARFEQGNLFAEAEIMIDIQPDEQLTLVGTVVDAALPGQPAHVGFSLVDEALQIQISPEIQKAVRKKVVPQPGASQSKPDSEPAKPEPEPESNEFALPGA